jgi:hypothetical protein
MSIKKHNTRLLQHAIAESDNFNMGEHTTCLIGHAARLDGQPAYSGSSFDYNSRDLCCFLGVEPTEENRYHLYMAGEARTSKQLVDVTKEDAIGMLDNLLDTGKIVWPWEK